MKICILYQKKAKKVLIHKKVCKNLVTSGLIDYLSLVHSHMWLVDPPNPYKIERNWECIFWKLYTLV